MSNDPIHQFHVNNYVNQPLQLGPLDATINDNAPAAYRGLGFPGAEDLGNMFQFKRDFEREFRAARDPAFARRLNPALQSFDAWLAANAARIPLE